MKWRGAKKTGNYISQKAGRRDSHRKRAPAGGASRRNGAGSGDEWLPRGSRVVSPEVVPRLRGFGGHGAGPMSISLAGPDCCGGLGNIDFREVMIAPGRVGAGRGILMATGFAGQRAPPPTPGGRAHRYQATGAGRSVGARLPVGGHSRKPPGLCAFLRWCMWALGIECL